MEELINPLKASKSTKSYSINKPISPSNTPTFLEVAFSNFNSLNTFNALFIEKSLSALKRLYFENETIQKSSRKEKLDDISLKIESYFEHQQTLNFDFILDIVEFLELGQEKKLKKIEKSIKKELDEIKENLGNELFNNEELKGSLNTSDFGSAWRGKMIGNLSDDIAFSDDNLSNLSVKSLSVEVGRRQGYEINVENFDLGLKEEGKLYNFHFVLKFF